MARRGSTLAVALAMSLLAACSTSGDDATPATTIATNTTPPDTPSTTSPPPTTTSTTAPTRTASPTTTIDPAQALAAEVEADLLETFRLTNDGFQDPTNGDKVDAALEGYVGHNREFIEKRINEFISNGWATIPHPSVEAALAGVSWLVDLGCVFPLVKGCFLAGGV